MGLWATLLIIGGILALILSCREGVVDAWEDFMDFLEDIEFTNEVDFRIPLKQFRQYYKVDPKKWQLHDFYVTYDSKYDIGFSFFGKIQYFFSLKKMKQENIKIEFLQDLQEDLAERVGEIRRNTQAELEKIRESIPKTESGTQDIERFFEVMKHDSNS